MGYSQHVTRGEMEAAIATAKEEAIAAAVARIKATLTGDAWAKDEATGLMHKIKVEQDDLGNFAPAVEQIGEAR